MYFLLPLETNIVGNSLQERKAGRVREGEGDQALAFIAVSIKSKKEIYNDVSTWNAQCILNTHELGGTELSSDGDLCPVSKGQALY